jgi:hypothetical protein
MVQIIIVGPRAEADEALRELLYGTGKITIERVEDNVEGVAGQRQIDLAYPRAK